MIRCYERSNSTFPAYCICREAEEQELNIAIFQGGYGDAY